jgi:hypothetical protein
MDNDLRREERAIFLVIAIVTGPIVLIAALRGYFGGGSTLCMLFFALALFGIVRTWRDSLPRARASYGADARPRRR